MYAQPVQRARVFSSVLLPRYGEQRVTLGEPGVDQAWSQALVPWHDPASETALRFPDARGYLADVRALTDLVVPARSTIKTFRAECLAGKPNMNKIREAEYDQPIEQVGRKLRKMMTWIDAKEIKPRT